MRFYKEPPPGFTSLTLSLKTSRQGDTPGVDAPAQTIPPRSHMHSQSATPKHNRHLDLVFVVSRKLSGPQTSPGERGDGALALSERLRSPGGGKRRVTES